LVYFIILTLVVFFQKKLLKKLKSHWSISSSDFLDQFYWIIFLLCCTGFWYFW
jgi:hypothetical protein